MFSFLIGLKKLKYCFNAIVLILQLYLNNNNHLYFFYSINLGNIISP